MQTETQGVKSEYIQSRSAERQAGTLVRTRPNKNKLTLSNITLVCLESFMVQDFYSRTWNSSDEGVLGRY